MTQLFAERILGVPWSVLGMLGLLLALVFLVVDTSGAATGPRWLVMRWFHPLCWLLLGIAALLRARIAPVPEEWAFTFALAGGATYAVFLVTTLSSRST